MVAEVCELLRFGGGERKVNFLEDSVGFCGYLSTDPSRVVQDPWRR